MYIYIYILKFVDILALFLFIRQKEHHHSFYASIISPLHSQVLSSSSSLTSFPFFTFLVTFWFLSFYSRSIFPRVFYLTRTILTFLLLSLSSEIERSMRGKRPEVRVKQNRSRKWRKLFRAIVSRFCVRHSPIITNRRVHHRKGISLSFALFFFLKFYLTPSFSFFLSSFRSFSTDTQYSLLLPTTTL